MVILAQFVEYSIYRKWKIYVALLIGLLAGYLCTIHQVTSMRQAADFSWPLHAVRLLLEGENPYTASDFAATFAYRRGEPLYYPLPSLLLLIPLAPLSSELAVGVFFGGSSALLAWALLREGGHRLLAMLSPSYLVALWSGQWSPLLMASALVAGTLPFLLAKPSLGLAALFIRRPQRAEWGFFALLCIISLILVPTWPLDWLRNLGEGTHAAPISFPPFGPVLLLVLLCWSNPRARVLLWLAIAPQLIYFYDQLLLFLIPRTFAETLFLVLVGWTTFLWWDPNPPSWEAGLFGGQLIMLSFMAALLIVFRQQIVGVKTYV
jgi:hypothetical protein